MAPHFPKLDFFESIDSSEEINNDQKLDGGNDPGSLTQMAFWYMIILISMLLTWLLLFFCLRIVALRQKTRSPQQRRMYVGSRARPSLGQPEPSIFVSPSNLPPPPKYECMAPPSYEEVVGANYPNFQIQPITTPITTALAAQNPQVQAETDIIRNDIVTTVNETIARNNGETVVTVSRPIAASSS